MNYLYHSQDYNPNLGPPKWGTAILLGILLAFGVYFLNAPSCKNILKEENHQKDFKSNLEETLVTIKRNSKDSSLIAFQNQIILSEKKAITKLKLEIGKLKKITQYLEAENEYLLEKIDQDYPVEVEKIDTNQYLKLPVKLTRGDKWHTLEVKLKKTKWDYSLTLVDSSKFYIGTLNRGFFRKSQPSVIYTNSNPYLKNFSMNNVTVDYKPPFWETRWFNLSVGFGLGFATSKLISKP